MALTDLFQSRERFRVSLDGEALRYALISTNRQGYPRQRKVDKLNQDEVRVSLNIDPDELPEDMDGDDVDHLEDRVATILYDELDLAHHRNR